MKTSKRIFEVAGLGFNSPVLALPVLMAVLGLGIGGCATKMRITTVPSDATVTLKNNATQEVFTLGQGRQEFTPRTEYGTSFSFSVSHKGFITRDLAVNAVPGSATDYLVNLKPQPLKAEEFEITGKIEDLINSRVNERLAERLKMFEDKMKGVEDDMRKFIAAQLEDAQDNMRLADEDRRHALLERVRAEFEKRNVESDKKVSVLENTFEVYKDALFSERYSAGIAGFDRRRIDNSVDSVNRIQRFIEDKRYAEAEGLVDKMLERDEYFAKGYALKGTVKYLMNKPKESIVAWERAIELDPNDRATQTQLASVYKQVGVRVPASSSVNPAPTKLPGKTSGLKVRDK